LNILKGFEFGERDCARTWHRQLEAMKLAYVDGLHYISQPQSMRVSVEELLHVDYAASRRALIGERALDPSPGQPKPGGTVYLACGDEEGKLGSFVESNYHGFGSAVLVPGNGIALQNR
ncbi:gamma-glutamyltransferase, partial [Pseudomonas aeruginosa]